MEGRIERLVRNQNRWGLAILGGMLVTQLLVIAWLGLQVWGIRQWRSRTSGAVTYLRNGFEDNKRVLEIVRAEQELQERRYRTLLTQLDVIERALKKAQPQ